MDTAKILYVENEAQRVLFADELAGQLSDGHWENATPHDHWQPWCNATVKVAPQGHPAGRTFYARRSSYNFLAKDLLDVVADRMIESVRAISPVWVDYDMAALRKDLKALKAIIKIVVKATPEDEVEAKRKAQVDAEAAKQRQAKQAADAERINALGKQLGISLYASPYSTRVEVRYDQLLDLLEAKAATVEPEASETLVFT